MLLRMLCAPGQTLQSSMCKCMRPSMLLPQIDLLAAAAQADRWWVMQQQTQKLARCTCSMTVMHHNSRPASRWCPTICITLLLIVLSSALQQVNEQQQQR
jgi:hypothetical protein